MMFQIQNEPDYELKYQYYAKKHHRFPIGNDNGFVLERALLWLAGPE